MQEKLEDKDKWLLYNPVLFYLKIPTRYGEINALQGRNFGVSST
jgi:hypothetical protein